MNKIPPKSVPSRAGKAGMPPGSLVYVGPSKSSRTAINATVYNSATILQRNSISAAEALSLIAETEKTANSCLWLNIDGLEDLDALRQIGEAFNIHPLVLEDICNPNQRPKAEHYEHFSFLVLRAFDVRAGSAVDSEQVSLILGKNFLLSFQEKEGDAFAKISERLANSDSRIRSQGIDYLAYVILDSIVDNYFPVLELVGGKLEETESRIVELPGESALRTLYRYKRRALELRRSIWPVRELLSNLDRSDSRFVSANTRIYLRDVYSHAIEVIDTIEIYREILTGLLDVYLSSQSNKLNEVMKVLTVITTIFMPLTFIAGIYGMNFEHMPELNSIYGYPAVIALMTVIALCMIIYFRRKRWI